MEPEDVQRLIEERLDGAKVEVRRARGDHDDDHLAATVVAPAFEGKSLVDQHKMVYDALGEHMTTDVHALELSTFAPDEAPEASDAEEPGI